MKGFIYRLGVSIQEFGERNKNIYVALVGMRIKRMVSLWK